MPSDRQTDRHADRNTLRSLFLRHRVHVFNWSVQRVHRISFAATTVSAFRRQSAVTPEWTVLIDQMSMDVVSIALINICILK